MINIKLVQGDITKLEVDAIVNAANTSLLGGGGVDGAIHRGGGPAILEECMQIRARQGGCPTGEAVITTAGLLPAKYVIHTVGPVWSQANKSEKDQLLTSCYNNSLTLAKENGLKAVAFPNISTGVYRFPKARAARIAIDTVQAFAKLNEGIEEIIFVCFDEQNFRIYEELLGGINSEDF